ncbi:hypothetical protein Tco_1146023 [Tanacetum coccineum]
MGASSSEGTKDSGTQARYKWYLNGYGGCQDRAHSQMDAECSGPANCQDVGLLAAWVVHRTVYLTPCTPPSISLIGSPKNSPGADQWTQRYR